MEKYIEYRFSTQSPELKKTNNRKHTYICIENVSKMNYDEIHYFHLNFTSEI